MEPDRVQQGSSTARSTTTRYRRELTMPKFRKKPVVIEAVQFVRPYSAITTFCPALEMIWDVNHVAGAVIPTLEGDMRADIGDWIIRGVMGECYPCKPDIFAATYEPADEGTDHE